MIVTHLEFLNTPQPPSPKTPKKGKKRERRKKRTVTYYKMESKYKTVARRQLDKVSGTNNSNTSSNRSTFGTMINQFISQSTIPQSPKIGSAI